MAQVPSKWLHPLTGRCKRPPLVKEGCFVLEHDVTGRFYVSESLTVSEDVDKQLSLLATGKHPCKVLNELYSSDHDIRVTEYPCKPKTQRKQLYAALLVNVTDYLCLNPEIYDLLKRKRRRRSNPKGA
jgi:hypothetical protein